MEIFGPGGDWTPESGKPGAVWCAQRVPDGQIGCSANRSRIGLVDMDDTDHFMASPNIRSLADDLGWCVLDQPLVWSEVYGGPGDRTNSLREWRALSLVAPSLGLKVTGDAAADRYPFSVKPDKAVTATQLLSVMRDGYEGTRFDVSQHAALAREGRQSPLACPWGPDELFQLLRIEPERAICTPTSGYVFVAQLRGGLPPSIANCLWFAYGPATTSCFIPVYAGVTDMPDSWDQAANFTRIDRQQAQWNFRLVHNLATRLGYQHTIQDVRRMIEPAEQSFFDNQAAVEQAALQIYQTRGPDAADRFLTDYARQCATDVGHAYRDLVDYLLLKHLVGNAEFTLPQLPRVVAHVPALAPQATH
jgi:dipeptidase